MTSDADILRALARDPSEGLRALVREHGAKVRSLLRNSFPAVGESSIEEAVCEALEDLWQRRESLRGDRNLGAYLALAARWRLSAALQTEERHRQRERAAAPPTPDAATPEPLDAAFKVALMACIDRLPPRQQAVLLADLRNGDPVPADVLAVELHASAESIHVARHQARRRVGRCLAERGFSWGREHGDD